MMGNDNYKLMRRLERTMVFAVAWVLGLGLASSVAWAQTPARLPGEEGSVLQWLIGIGLIAVVCATALLNPKRSHLT